MFKNLLIVFVQISFVLGEGFIYPEPKDPFLESHRCLPHIKNRHVQVDPNYCDRVLVCPANNGLGVAMYCPKGMVYNPKLDACVPIEEAEEICRERKVQALETPNKPVSDCDPNPKEGTSGLRFIPTQPGSYFKLAENTEHAYFYCKRGILKAYTFECIHPELSKVILDNPGPRKCFNKGYVVQQKKAAKGKVAIGGSSKNLPSVSFKGLPIRFMARTPICPTHEKIKKRFDFGIASRIKHYEDCVHFWTCGHDDTPRKHSCPHTRVFDPESERCIFYKEAKAPCNKVFDNENIDTLNTHHQLYKLEKHGESLEQIVRSSVRELKARAKLLKIFEPGTPQYRATALRIQRLKDQIQKMNPLGNNKEEDSSKDRSKRSANYKITELPEHLKNQIDFRKAYYFHDFENVAEGPDGVLRCPPVKYLEPFNRTEIMAQALMPHFNPAIYYDMSIFRLGTYNAYPVSGDCGAFWQCSPYEDALYDNRPSFRLCPLGAFQPLLLKPFHSYEDFAFVKETGVCTDARKTKVKGCEEYVPSAEAIAKAEKEAEIEAMRKKKEQEKKKEEENFDFDDYFDNLMKEIRSDQEEEMVYEYDFPTK